MTRPDGPAPRWGVALLAELDAGALSVARAAEVRAAVEADPAAIAVLGALAATRAELAALSVPEPPPGSTERWAAAVREAAGTSPASAPQHPAAPPSRPAPAAPHHPGVRSWRRPRVGRGQPHPPTARPTPARRALFVLVLLTAGLLGWPRPDPPPPDRIELLTAGRSALGHTDLGPLADPVRRASCLRAARAPGVDPDTAPLAGRRVELARGPALLLVYPTGERGVFDVVVVDPDCGPAGGTLLGTARIGR